MNLSIPDAAAELAVSESRLRRTLQGAPVRTLVEFRHTRTGVRKTTVLDSDAMDLLRDRLALGNRQAEAAMHGTADRDQGINPVGLGATGDVDECSTTAVAIPCFPPASETGSADDPVGEIGAPCAAALAGAGSVPVAQFNALLYQHNVLRQELSRVTDYLDGCDRLLGEMVRTIAALEERTQRLDPVRPAQGRVANPLKGALTSVSASFQHALFSRATLKSAAKPTAPFFGGALAGR